MSQSTIKSKERVKELLARAETYTVNNDPKGYDSFWADDELLDMYLEPGRLANFRFVAQMCAHWSGDVIDMGCGSGTMLEHLIACDSANKKSIAGVDFAASAIERCRALLPNGKFLQRDLVDTGLPDASFDLVLSIQTMEHLDRPAEAFAEMWRLMRPGARLLVTVPNGALDSWDGHKNFWTRESFTKMAGRQPDRFETFNDERNLLFLFQKSGGF